MAFGAFYLRDTAGSPERARWLHLARSGSQSERAIWFILPARGASRLINHNTTVLYKPTYLLCSGTFNECFVFEGMNYARTNCAFYFAQESLAHYMGGTFFYFDRVLQYPLDNSRAILSRFYQRFIHQQIISQTVGSGIRIRSTYMQRVLK